jgi:hypothetical protein
MSAAHCEAALRLGGNLDNEHREQQIRRDIWQIALPKWRMKH